MNMAIAPVDPANKRIPVSGNSRIMPHTRLASAVQAPVQFIVLHRWLVFARGCCVGFRDVPAWRWLMVDVIATSGVHSFEELVYYMTSKATVVRVPPLIKGGVCIGSAESCCCVGTMYIYSRGATRIVSSAPALWWAHVTAA